VAAPKLCKTLIFDKATVLGVSKRMEEAGWIANQQSVESASSITIADRILQKTRNH